VPTVQIATSLNDILRWWAMQMRDLLPRRKTRRPTLALMLSGPDALYASLWPSERPDTELSGTPADAHDPAALRSLAAQAGGRVVVAVPDAALLDTTVDLPATAERHLADIVRFEIDRLTPFRPDEVMFSADIVRRLAGKIVVRLRLVPATVIAPALAALDSASLRARAIVSLDGDRTIPLDRPRARGTRARVVVALACVAALMAAPFLHQQMALSETARALDEASPATRLAEGLRTRLDRALHGPAALVAETRATGRLPDILARLSDALPDDTYLTALTLKHRHLEFNGLSADAPALIGRLDSAGFANAALSGPVLRAPDGKHDVFSARADLPPETAR